jgi:hypothetical protein
VKTSLPPGGSGVDRLLQAAEPDAALGEAGDGVDQVAQRPASRSSFHTTRVLPGRSWSRNRSRTERSLRAPLAVSVNTPVAAGALEGVDLQVGLLVGGGDARIAEQMAHADDGRRTL